MNKQHEQPEPPAQEYFVDKRAVAWTLAWFVPFAAYAVLPHIRGAYQYTTYLNVRTFALLLLLVLAAAGIYRAWKFIGGTKTDPPWYTDGFLVALLIFWAVAPPTWFFFEYYMFDTGDIALPIGDKKDEFLKDTKSYADLASKIWAAVGASLGAAIAAARK